MPEANSTEPASYRANLGSGSQIPLPVKPRLRVRCPECQEVGGSPESAHGAQPTVRSHQCEGVELRLGARSRRFDSC